MDKEVILSQFTALVSGQVGTAVLSSKGIKWRAIGGVGTFWEVKGSEMKKFQVSPSTSKLAKFQFERVDGKKYVMQVVLTEDEKCGSTEVEIVQKERVILEKARADIRNQKHWPMNYQQAAQASSSQPSSSSISNNSSAKGKDDSTSSGKSAQSKPTVSGGWGDRAMNPTASFNQTQLSVGQSTRNKKTVRPVQSEQDKEIEEIKEHLLASDQDLNNQFRELVVENQVLTEMDFWETKKHLLSAEMGKRQGSQESLESWWKRKVEEWTKNPETKKFKISLKYDDKYKIFTLFPEVRGLYEQKVPHEVKEKDFWSNFLTSEFLHMGREVPKTNNASSSDSGQSSLSAGMFASVGNLDENVARTPQEVFKLTASIDPSVDLVSAYGDYIADPAIADVYTPMVAKESDKPSEIDIRDSSERASVINRYNRRARQLLTRNMTPFFKQQDGRFDDDMKYIQGNAGLPLLITQSMGFGQENDTIDKGDITQEGWGSMLTGIELPEPRVEVELRDFALKQCASKVDSGLGVYDQHDLSITQTVHELLRHLFVTMGSCSNMFDHLPLDKQRKIRAIENRMQVVLSDIRNKINQCLEQSRSPTFLRRLEAQLVNGLEAVEAMTITSPRHGDSKKRGFIDVVDSPKRSIKVKT